MESAIGALPEPSKASVWEARLILAGAHALMGAFCKFLQILYSRRRCLCMQ